MTSTTNMNDWSNCPGTSQLRAKESYFCFTGSQSKACAIVCDNTKCLCIKFWLYKCNHSSEQSMKHILKDANSKLRLLEKTKLKEMAKELKDDDVHRFIKAISPGIQFFNASGRQHTVRGLHLIYRSNLCSTEF